MDEDITRRIDRLSPAARELFWEVERWGVTLYRQGYQGVAPVGGVAPYNPLIRQTGCAAHTERREQCRVSPSLRDRVYRCGRPQ